MRASNILAVAVLALVALAGVGCSSTGVSIYVDAASGTNDGQPFYAVVRSIDEAAFVTDAYETVAAKVFASPADQTVVRSAVIYPGVNQVIELKEKPTGKTLAVYFLFTKPSERWKTSRSQPLPDSIEIKLEDSKIKDES